MRAASFCPRDAPGTTAPKHECPNYPVPKPPSGKAPKRGVCYSLGGGVGRSWSSGLGMGPNFASGLRVPALCPGHSRAQKRAPEGPRPNTAQRKRAQTVGRLWPWWGGGAKLVRRNRNGAKLCEQPPFARGTTRAQPRPKTGARRPPSQNRPAEKGQNGGCAIALVGGCGEVGPPDSKWGQTLLAASVCPRDAPGKAAPKNERPNYPVPKPPSGKGPKRGVCYSLGGGVGLSWSAGLGMGPNFANGLLLPAGCPGHRRAQKRVPKGPRPKTAQRKRAKTGGVP